MQAPHSNLSCIKYCAYLLWQWCALNQFEWETHLEIFPYRVHHCERSLKVKAILPLHIHLAKRVNQLPGFSIVNLRWQRWTFHVDRTLSCREKHRVPEASHQCNRYNHRATKKRFPLYMWNWLASSKWIYVVWLQCEPWVFCYVLLQSFCSSVFNLGRHSVI